MVIRLSFFCKWLSYSLSHQSSAMFFFKTCLFSSFLYQQKVSVCKIVGCGHEIFVFYIKNSHSFLFYLFLHVIIKMFSLPKLSSKTNFLTLYTLFLQSLVLEAGTSSHPRLSFYPVCPFCLQVILIQPPQCLWGLFSVWSTSSGLFPHCLTSFFFLFFHC